MNPTAKRAFRLNKPIALLIEKRKSPHIRQRFTLLNVHLAIEILQRRSPNIVSHLNAVHPRQYIVLARCAKRVVRVKNRVAIGVTFYFRTGIGRLLAEDSSPITTGTAMPAELET